MMMPETIEEELLLSQDSDGIIKVEKVLETAKQHQDWPVAKHLEWDDKKAGEQYRLWQIRNLIQLHVIYAPGERKLISLTIDRKNPGGGYRHIEDVMKVEDLRRCALIDALNELERMERKYQWLQELATIWKAAAKIRKIYKPPEGEQPAA